MTFKSKIYDKRVSDRYVEKGFVKQSDIDSHMKALPDDANNVEWVQLEMEENDLTESEDVEESETVEE